MLAKSELSVPLHGASTPSRFRLWVLAAVSASAMCAMINLISFSPLIGDIARDLRVDLGAASLRLVGAPTLATAVGIALSGFVIDAVGVFPVLLGCQILMMVSTAALLIVGPHLDGLFVIRLTQGLSGAGLTASITPAIARWFPNHEMGRAMAFPTIGASVGTVVGLNLAPILTHALGGWRMGTGVLGLVALATLILTVPIALRSKREHPAALEVSQPTLAAATSSILRMRLFWVGLAVMALGMWANLAFGDLAPGFLAVPLPTGAGYGARMAGLLMSLTSITGMIGAPLAGLLVDKIFHGANRPVLLIGWILSALFFSAILLPAIHSHTGALIVVLLLCGLQNPFVNVGLLSYAAKVFPAQMLGRICGLWIAVSFFAGAAGVIVGSLLLHATGNYRASILGLGVISLLGVALSALLRRPATVIADPVAA